MTRTAIFKKLVRELSLELTTEKQVVYILAEIRKVIESANLQEHYFALDFYCSWALHARMSRAGAARILKRFDAAHPLLAKSVPLPRDLAFEISSTTKLERFREELKQFLISNELPTERVISPGAWARFIRLYASIIQDCPLLVEGRRVELRYLDHVSVRLDLAKNEMKTPQGNEVLFRVRWTCFGKDGKQGHHDVYYSHPQGSEQLTEHVET